MGDTQKGWSGTHVDKTMYKSVSHEEVFSNKVLLNQSLFINDSFSPIISSLPNHADC